MEQETNEAEFSDPRSKLILIVDDDEGQLDLIDHIVRKQGFQSERAVSAIEALRKMQASPRPDAIVLDLMLPGMGGYEFLRELQASGVGHVPVIVVTARVMDRKAVDMIKAEPNVRDVFQKPPSPARLSGVLHSALKTRPHVPPP